MPAEVTEKEAIVLLPVPPAADTVPPAIRRWLCQLNVEAQGAQGATALSRVLAVLEREVQHAGFAPLRFWGHTGDRPGAWLAAADPVYLEARLDHVVVCRLEEHERLAGDLEAAFRELQKHLGGEGEMRFCAAETEGYLCVGEPILTPEMPPAAVYGRELGSVLPTGRGASEYQRLQSEIQMVLHQASFQARRIADGLRPMNGLWVWGGGAADQPIEEPLPPLYARDTLLRGYWYQREQSVSVWPGSLLACAAQSPAGFVAALPTDAVRSDDSASLECLMDALRLLESGQLDTVRLLFETGVSVRARRRRWWHRRRNDLSWLHGALSA